ncbi:short-chain dehydrogenase/reductase family 16C member 6 [Galendromus occidentalis]|uniref:Short-chain dehydrogenase/reductase 3 n=1 Tax=Galendromus occidentalis TaxID=34638 RepID=A0AAJ6VYR9_9ACAR|nr:short-chain dehydrogenase/reductase family 16C member 6 [Galendromus occidentalis]
MLETPSTAKTIAEVLGLILTVMWIILRELAFFVIPRPSKSLRDKTVVLTGAAQGIGRLVAEKIARLGARCVLVDIDKEKNDKAAAEIRAANFDAWSYACDISKEDQIEKMHDWIKREVGPVDVVINNAAIVNCQEILALEPHRVRRNFEVNTLSHIWMIREFLPSMKERGEGHFVATSSIAGMLGTAYLTDYCASKFAVRGLMSALEEELNTQGFGGKIHLTTVCPLAIKTTMFEAPRSRFPWAMPLLEPEEVANGLVDAMLENRREVIIPTRVGVLNKLCSLLPTDAILSLQRFMGYEVGQHGQQSSKEKSL